MSPQTNQIIPKGQLLHGIQGLRGIAALAVVFYHLIHLTGIKAPSGFEFIGRDFGFSVHLFFILSAYSLMHTTATRTHHSTWIRDYFIKRFFRIAPLFYAVIVYFVVQIQPQSLVTLILNLSFTFGFIPPTGFVWGSWSIGVEMIFYAIFPVLLLLIKTHRVGIVFVVLSVIVASTLRYVLHHQYVQADLYAKFDWSYFSFEANFCYFAMGMYAYLLNQKFDPTSVLISKIVPITALTILLSLMLFNIGIYLSGVVRADIVLWGFGLTALSIWQSANPSALIANRFFGFLGDRSFSIYLLHPIVIVLTKPHLIGLHAQLSPKIGSAAYFVVAAALIVTILIASEFTYRVLELPGIRLGRKLIQTMSPKSAKRPVVDAKTAT